MIEPYTKDRGTFRGRKEIPLKECYEAVNDIMKEYDERHEDESNEDKSTERITLWHNCC